MLEIFQKIGINEVSSGLEGEIDPAEQSASGKQTQGEIFHS
jgi:hypothetical protein